MTKFISFCQYCFKIHECFNQVTLHGWKKILWYLGGTKIHGIKYVKDDQYKLVGFTDTD